MKHFQSLASELGSDLTVVYYQRKPGDHALQKMLKKLGVNLKFIKLDKLIDKSKSDSFSLLNTSKNVLFWRHSYLSQFKELSDRFSTIRNRDYRTLIRNPTYRAFIEYVENTSHDHALPLAKNLGKRMEDKYFLGKKLSLKLKKDLKGAQLVLESPYLDGDIEPIAFRSLCKSLKIPTALLMASWDNFENKGIASPEPDAFLVWSEYHFEALQKFHGCLKNNILTIGSEIIRTWLSIDLKALNSDTSEKLEFLYICSSSFVGGHEEERLILQLAEFFELQSSNSIKLFIKPHPQVPLDQGAIANLNTKARNLNITVLKSEDYLEWEKTKREGLITQISNVNCVLGINSSLMLQLAAVGFPVVSIDPKSFDVKTPKTKHYDFLKRYLSAEIKSPKELQKLLDKEFLDLILLESKAKRALIQDDLMPKTNWGQVIDNVQKIVWALDSRESHENQAKTNSLLERKSLLDYIKTARRIYSSQGLVSLYFHTRRFIENQRELRTNEAIDVFRKDNLQDVHNAKSLKVVSFSSKKMPNVSTFSLADSVKIKNEAEFQYFANKVISEIGDELMKGRRLVFGPWFSELGFEILYWIPFINNLQNTYDGHVKKPIVLSRGGFNPLYEKMGISQVNVLKWFDANTWSGFTKQIWDRLGGLKQSQMTDLEIDLIEKLFSDLGVEDDVLLIHPQVLFKLFRPYWRSDIKASALEPFLDFPERLALDKDREYDFFVKFYGRPSLSLTRENRQKLSRVISTIGGKRFLYISNDSYNDDHEILPAPDQLSDNMEQLFIENFERNLEIQIGALGRCDRSIMTYGGMSYLSLYFGQDCMAIFEDERKFAKSHLELSRILAAQTGSELKLVHVDDNRAIRNWIGE